MPRIRRSGTWTVVGAGAGPGPWSPPLRGAPGGHLHRRGRPQHDGFQLLLLKIWRRPSDEIFRILDRAWRIECADGRSSDSG